MNRLTKDQDIQVMEWIPVKFVLNETDVLQIWTKLFMYSMSANNQCEGRETL